MAEIHELSALQLAAAYATGDTDPLEATEHYLSRIETYGDTVGGFITVTAERALAQARTAKETYADDAPERSALFGVPMAFKDLTSTAGVRTTFGSATMSDFVPDTSDQIVLNLESAGMVSLGKTSTPEFGSPCYTEPEVAPPARTPYDLSRGAGGSSGGAATAVASGLLPVAPGSDGGGSIRIPASSCGLVGLKPSRGRISSAPMYGDISGLATAGSLATTVRDAAALLDVMSGPAPGDPTWAERLPADESYLAHCERDPGTLTIARFATPVISDAEIDPQVLFAYDQLSERLEDLGHTVVDIDPPMTTALLPVFETVWAVGAAIVPVPQERRQQLRPITRWLYEQGAKVSATDFAASLVRMHQAAAAVIRSIAPYDAVLTPTLAALPAPVGSIRNDADPAADFQAQKDFTPFTALWNVTGMPAISLPTGWSPEGLPIGTMLAAHPGREQLLCGLGAQIEAAYTTDGRSWSRPPVAL